MSPVQKCFISFFLTVCLCLFLWSRLQSRRVRRRWDACLFIISFLFSFLLRFASLASRANHTHLTMAATPGVCCMKTSEFGISSPGLLLPLWGKMGCGAISHGIDGVYLHAIGRAFATSTAMLTICFYIFFLFER